MHEKKKKNTRRKLLPANYSAALIAVYTIPTLFSYGKNSLHIGRVYTEVVATVLRVFENWLVFKKTAKVWCARFWPAANERRRRSGSNRSFYTPRRSFGENCWLPKLKNEDIMDGKREREKKWDCAKTERVLARGKQRDKSCIKAFSIRGMFIYLYISNSVFD